MALAKVTGTFETVVDLMSAAVDQGGDREAFVDGSVRLTFRQWSAQAEGVACLFADMGVRRGDVVCLLLPSSADYAVCYQAAMRLGAVTSGINNRLGPNEVQSILNRCRPRVTVVDSGMARFPEGEVVVDREELRTAWSGGPMSHPPRLDAHDPVAVVWTSGTTGHPKGAVFDHANLRAVARGAGDLSMPGDRRLSPLPFAHVGYMTRPWDEVANLITTVIVPTPWKAAQALRLMVDEEVSVGQGVPTQWRLILDLPDLDRADLTHLRVAGTGASSVAPELVNEMRHRLGCPVVVGYTSTEAAITTRSRIGDSDRDVACTVGRASEGVEVQVMGEDGSRLGAGEVGQVQCRSQAMMRSYLGDDELTARVINSERWLTTGDLGWVDDREYLTLVGRKTDMYIRGGYNVYPTEVEAALAEHPAISEVAVVGLPDPMMGEVGAAFVVEAARASGPPEGSSRRALLLPAGKSFADELRSWCKCRLADYKAPDQVWVVSELPLTQMSKVDKASLKQMAVKARGE